MRRAAAIVLVLASGLLAACGGESDADKAQTKVCDARADIAKQVDTLKGLTVSTATTSQIKTSVQAIADDLGTIAAAQGDLSDERRTQVEEANKAFADELKTITSTLVTTTSISEAKTQLQAALSQLADSYRQTFAKVDCG